MTGGSPVSGSPSIQESADCTSSVFLEELSNQNLEPPETSAKMDQHSIARSFLAPREGHDWSSKERLPTCQERLRTDGVGTRLRHLGEDASLPSLEETALFLDKRL